MKGPRTDGSFRGLAAQLTRTTDLHVFALDGLLEWSEGSTDQEFRTACEEALAAAVQYREAIRRLRRSIRRVFSGQGARRKRRVAT